VTDRPDAAGQQAATYSERLRPSPWSPLLALAAALMLGLAYGAALGAVGGAITFVLVAAVGLWLVAGRIVTVRVDDAGLHVGKATLPPQFIGRVAALDTDAAALARGAGGDARAYLVLRTGYSSQAVAVEVDDPRDPHSYWLISTRHPQPLASAIIAVTSPDTESSETHRQ
jgi:hypothetical protein